MHFRKALFALELALLGGCFAQSGAVIPQGGSGHTTGSSCVILKRMGPADQVTSHLYSFGIRGKQFQYVEGKLPDGFPFHGRLTDHDVRNLQGRGAEVIVLNSAFTSDDLKQARGECKGEAGKGPMQVSTQGDQKAPAATPLAAEGSSGVASAPETNATAPVQGLTGKVTITSVPDGCDIEVDGNFVGSTPSDIQLAEGEHTVTVQRSGFKTWERKLKVTGGSSVHLNAGLEKAAK